VAGDLRRAFGRHPAGRAPDPHPRHRDRERRRGLRRARRARPPDLPGDRVVPRAARVAARPARGRLRQGRALRAHRPFRRSHLLAVQAVVAEGQPARRARAHAALAERRALPGVAAVRRAGRRSVARLALAGPRPASAALGDGSDLQPGPGARDFPADPSLRRAPWQRHERGGRSDRPRHRMRRRRRRSRSHHRRACRRRAGVRRAPRFHGQRRGPDAGLAGVHRRARARPARLQPGRGRGRAADPLRVRGLPDLGRGHRVVSRPVRRRALAPPADRGGPERAGLLPRHHFPARPARPHLADPGSAGPWRLVRHRRRCHARGALPRAAGRSRFRGPPDGGFVDPAARAADDRDGARDRRQHQKPPADGNQGGGLRPPDRGGGDGRGDGSARRCSAAARPACSPISPRPWRGWPRASAPSSPGRTGSRATTPISGASIGRPMPGCDRSTTPPPRSQPRPASGHGLQVELDPAGLAGGVLSDLEDDLGGRPAPQAGEAFGLDRHHPARRTQRLEALRGAVNRKSLQEPGQRRSRPSNAGLRASRRFVRRAIPARRPPERARSAVWLRISTST
jgi:hypothetical protein